jgi:hypothetical protein
MKMNMYESRIFKREVKDEGSKMGHKILSPSHSYAKLRIIRGIEYKFETVTTKILIYKIKI